MQEYDINQGVLVNSNADIGIYICTTNFGMACGISDTQSAVWVIGRRTEYAANSLGLHWAFEFGSAVGNSLGNVELWDQLEGGWGVQQNRAGKDFMTT